ncbi:hypothetical protein DNU42_22820 [Salmonella enterica subsp. enterica serovar Newport]|nr:hypothetical protein [Salmonella enterica subsp. enterica serovar Newport]
MIITNLKGEEIYKNKGDFEQDGIVDAIVKAGGADKVHVNMDTDIYNTREIVKAVRFFKTIGYDINKFPIDKGSFHSVFEIELIKNGYDMYKVGGDNIPVIAKCNDAVLEECINRGLDLTRFNKDNHFTKFEAYNEFSEESFIDQNEHSHFIECRNRSDIDRYKLELLIENGLINPETANDFNGYTPLYYSYSNFFEMKDELVEKLLNAYSQIEINEAYIFDADREPSRDFIFKRYIETCEDKQGAIEQVKGLFEQEGLDIAQSERIMATIARYDNAAIQEAFTHTAPKTSTRRRM